MLSKYHVRAVSHYLYSNCSPGAWYTYRAFKDKKDIPISSYRSLLSYVRMQLSI
jgi:hypothetical protein